MAKLILMFVMIAVCLVPVAAVAQVKSTPAPTVEASEDVGIRVMSRRDARKVGLTIRNLIAITRDLKSAGQLTGDKQRDAESVLTRAIEKNPKAFANPSLDWDSILAFIERILPLIMTIISIF